MLESPATDPGRAAEEMPKALRVELMPEAENLAVALTEAVLADGLGFKGPFEEFGRIAEPLLLDALGAARRDGAQIAIAQLQADLIAARKERGEWEQVAKVEAAERRRLNDQLRESALEHLARDISDEQAADNLIALAKMYGEACGALAEYRFAAVEWQGEQAAYKAAVEEEAAQLRARLHEAEKGAEAMRQVLRLVLKPFPAVIGPPEDTLEDYTSAVSRFRAAARAALTPAPEANQEAGDGR